LQRLRRSGISHAQATATVVGMIIKFSDITGDP
jgi:hypothetical protein